MNRWNSIDTAPLGCPTLLFDPYYMVRVGRWRPRVVAEIEGLKVPENADGVWATFCPGKETSGEPEIVLDPTAWAEIPLPLPIEGRQFVSLQEFNETGALTPDLIFRMELQLDTKSPGASNAAHLDGEVTGCAERAAELDCKSREDITAAAQKAMKAFGFLPELGRTHSEVPET